ncbi:DUF5721 family protein [Anaeromicropila herbilytica]|uniref:Uncharacterized protein n=1 Tax=Anaeromicropila herbilytica TaxID=2785025 RepID=A0A7R7ICV6_9FIRM|nr:DUF5721 family protein [Anaeromicropila herbilytica]BCN30261.1 hypothetical protein bsdtb5_15560 [Anaeromicropila herbilytica]
MISLKIADVKAFMSSLLIHETFDNFLLVELDIATFNNFHISGYLNKNFYSTDELELLEDREYSKWSEVKSVAVNLIKGKKTPLSFKVVFLLSKQNIEKILSRGNLNFRLEEINGLFLNMKFENGELRLITGTSLKTFSLDKSLENEWDANMKSFLKHYEIAFEEE